jgi:hypothetical protein
VVGIDAAEDKDRIKAKTEEKPTARKVNRRSLGFARDDSGMLVAKQVPRKLLPRRRKHSKSEKQIPRLRLG